MAFSLEDLQDALKRTADVLIESKDLLTYIDNLSGDGDLGISMEKVGLSLIRELTAQPAVNPSELLFRCARSININAPSTMGTLISFSVFEAAKQLKDKETIEDRDALIIPRKMVETIMINGRAQLGDKTVLDALIPYSDALQESYLECFDIVRAAKHAALRAEDAANATKGCIAKIGRAKWIAERSRNCPDGGAVVCALITNMLIHRRLEIQV